MRNYYIVRFITIIYFEGSSIHNRSDKSDDNTIYLMTIRLYLPVVTLKNCGCWYCSSHVCNKKMAEWEVDSCVNSYHVYASVWAGSTADAPNKGEF